MPRLSPAERRRNRARAAKREERQARRNAAANARRKALRVLSGREAAPLDRRANFTEAEARMALAMWEGKLNLDGSPVEPVTHVVEMFQVAIRNG